MTTIPLRVCVALTIHKSQGMTIGPGENFEHAVVYLPDKSKNQKSTAGLELVGISRVTSPEFLAIGNHSKSLCIANLKKLELVKQMTILGLFTNMLRSDQVVHVKLRGNKLVP